MSRDGKSFYPIEIPTPVTYYKFDDNLDDSSSNGRILSGSPNYDSGKFYKAFKNATVSRANQDLFSGSQAGGPYTISFWLVRQPLNTFAMYTDKDSLSELNVSIFSSGSLVVQLNNLGEEVTLATGVLADGVFHHYAITVEDGVINLYVDGNLVGTDSVSDSGASFSNTTTLDIIPEANRVDDLSIFSRVLTPKQITVIAAGTDPLSDLL